MTPTPSSINPDAASKFLPMNQYLTPLDSAGDVTKCAKHEVTDCNPMSSVPPKANSMLAPDQLWDLSFSAALTATGTESNVISSPFVSAGSASSFAPPGPPTAVRKPLSCPCGYSTSRSFNMKRHQQFCRERREGKKEDPMSEATTGGDSTKGSSKDLHNYSGDSLPGQGSNKFRSNNLQIPTMGGEDQPLSQDEIGLPKLVIKRENVEDSLGYLNTLCSPEPGPSSANAEELDEVSSLKTDSDESSSIIETCVDNQKSLMVEKIVFIAAQWLRLKLDTWRRNAGDNSENAPKTSEAPPGSYLPTEPPNHVKCGNKKRKATERGSCETGDEGEDGNREDQGSSGMSTKEPENLKYACPYFKYNPAKYKDWRTCPGPGWNDVHRVKEHLYRRHKQLQHRCARCQQPFTDEQSLISHQRTEESCPLREMEYVEGFDAAQEASLKSRKRANQTLSEAEKWRRVFTILFPHVLQDDIPSPFYDYSQMPQKDQACHLPSSSLTQSELLYVSREVPQRFRQALTRDLDRDLTILEENLRRRAGDSLRTLVEETLQELRQTRLLGNPAQRPRDNNDIPAPSEGPQVLISEQPRVESANLHFEGGDETCLDNFDFDSFDLDSFDFDSFDFDPFDPSSFLDKLQSPSDNGGLIEDLLRSGEDGTGEATKQSDSGYVSNSPG